MIDVAVHALHLCSGYGGFELALRIAGVETRTVAHVERESHAASVLVARMEDEALDRAPIWDDVDTFPAEQFAGRVDLVTAGFPCQPFSAAGRRKGLDDDRWLWPSIADVVRRSGARMVFLENVPLVVKRGLPVVLADLAELGFDAEWCVLGAHDVGAPHKRQRWFLLASLADGDSDGRAPVRQPQRQPRLTHGPGGEDVGDPGGSRRSEVARGAPADESQPAGRPAHPADLTDGAGQDVADTGRLRLVAPIGSTTSDPARRLVESGGSRALWPPLPGDADGWRQWEDDGGPQPGLRRVIDGATGRLERRDPQLPDRLHLLGNGLVPQVAARALIHLADRLNINHHFWSTPE